MLREMYTSYKVDLGERMKKRKEESRLCKPVATRSRDTIFVDAFNSHTHIRSLRRQCVALYFAFYVLFPILFFFLSVNLRTICGFLTEND